MDKWEKAACDVLDELGSRHGIGDELNNCDDDVKDEIIDALTTILRKALP